MRLSWQEVMVPVAFALAMAFVVAEAQISTSCGPAVLNLQPCLGYIAVGNTSAAGPECCTPLNNTLSSNETSTCLCELSASFATTNSSLNVTRAQEIASDCKVTIPDAVILCLTNTSSTASTSSNTTSPGSSSSSPLLNAEGWSLSITIFSVLGIYVCSSWFIF